MIAPIRTLLTPGRQGPPETSLVQLVLQLLEREMNRHGEVESEDTSEALKDACRRFSEALRSGTEQESAETDRIAVALARTVDGMQRRIAWDFLEWLQLKSEDINNPTLSLRIQELYEEQIRLAKELSLAMNRFLAALSNKDIPIDIRYAEALRIAIDDMPDEIVPEFVSMQLQAENGAHLADLYCLQLHSILHERLSRDSGAKQIDWGNTSKITREFAPQIDMRYMKQGTIALPFQDHSNEMKLAITSSTLGDRTVSEGDLKGAVDRNTEIVFEYAQRGSDLAGAVGCPKPPFDLRMAYFRSLSQFQNTHSSIHLTETDAGTIEIFDKRDGSHMRLFFHEEGSQWRPVLFFGGAATPTAAWDVVKNLIGFRPRSLKLGAELVKHIEDSGTNYRRLSGARGTVARLHVAGFGWGGVKAIHAATKEGLASFVLNSVTPGYCVRKDLVGKKVNTFAVNVKGDRTTGWLSKIVEWFGRLLNRPALPIGASVEIPTASHFPYKHFTAYGLRRDRSQRPIHKALKALELAWRRQ